MLDKYKHVSFDLDGTLVHTVPEYRHELVPKVVKELGGKIREKHSVDRFWFEAQRDKIIRDAFGIEPDRFWFLFRKLDTPQERSTHTRAYEDVENSLKKLKESGKTISIITGAPHAVAQLEIKKLNGAPYDLFLSIHSGGYIEKPDPQSFHFVIEKSAISPEDTLYIGNSNEDALFAKNAGVDFIFIDRNEHKFNLEDSSIAKVESLEQLFTI